LVTRFLTVLIVIVCLAGVLVSALVLREHYNNEPSPCRINDRWDCGLVNHSPYAVIHGVPWMNELPVALIGIMGYALLAVSAGRAPILTALGALAGFIFALRLTYIEWRVLMIWCLYCVSSQILITIVLLLAIAAVAVERRASRRVEVSSYVHPK
jgi:vitamin-K-epoxide reductase (warfarin-sensitive)